MKSLWFEMVACNLNSSTVKLMLSVIWSTPLIITKIHEYVLIEKILVICL